MLRKVGKKIVLALADVVGKRAAFFAGDHRTHQIFMVAQAC